MKFICNISYFFSHDKFSWITKNVRKKFQLKNTKEKKINIDLNSIYQKLR